MADDRAARHGVVAPDEAAAADWALIHGLFAVAHDAAMAELRAEQARLTAAVAILRRRQGGAPPL